MKKRGVLFNLLFLVHVKRIVHPSRVSSCLGNVSGESEKESLGRELQGPNAYFLYAALPRRSVLEDVASKGVIHLCVAKRVSTWFVEQRAQDSNIPLLISPPSVRCHTVSNCRQTR